MARQTRIEGATYPGQFSDVQRFNDNTQEIRRSYFSGDSWYFRARKDVLSGFIAKYLPPGTRALDVGCGDGWLVEYLPGHKWYGVELDPVLRKKATAKGMNAIEGHAENLPFPDGYFDAVCMLDVLEHLPEEAPTIREVRRVMKPQGRLFISVPLYPQLWSEHDKRCGHYRRYRKNEAASLVEQYGYSIVGGRFFLSLLLPIVFLMRRVFRNSAGKDLPRYISNIAYRTAVLNTKLPFGLTELLVAKGDVR